jgi:pimeloyl-ACP methyl ester carboxylesterase
MTTALLVHGFPGNANDLAPLEEALRARGLSVLRPDLLGFGAHAGLRAFDELWVDAQARHLASLVTGPVVVYAHDFGVPCAVTLAATRPELVHGLVLSSGNLLSDPPLAPPMRLLGVPVLGALVEAALFSRPANRFMAKDGTRRAGAPRPSVNGPDELAAIRTIFATALKQLPSSFAPVEQRARALAVPVHFVWGDRDPFFPVQHLERMRRAVPGATMTVLDGVGHFPPLEATQACADAVAQLAG